MPWFSFDISALCVAEAVALVTAWGLFIGMEGVPEHFATFVPKTPGSEFLSGMLQGCSGGPPGTRNSCFAFSRRLASSGLGIVGPGSFCFLRSQAQAGEPAAGRRSSHSLGG